MKPRKCEKTGKIGYRRASDAKKTIGRLKRLGEIADEIADRKQCVQQSFYYLIYSRSAEQVARMQRNRGSR